MAKKMAHPAFAEELPSMWLSDEQRAYLRASAQVGRDYSKENERLNLAIAQVRDQNPSAFWTNETLVLRRFFNEPARPIPHQSFVIGN